MKSLASLEGYLLIDNRVNPGVPDEIMVSQGLPVGSGRGIFEEAVYTCGHCQAQVVKNRQRTRPRGFCKKCNHVLCDPCDARYVASAHECKPFVAVIEEYLESVERESQVQRSPIVLTP